MRITRFGWAVFGVLTACIVVALVGGPTARFIALGVVALLVLAVVGEGLGGFGGWTDAARKQETLERAAIERKSARDQQQGPWGV